MSSGRNLKQLIVETLRDDANDAATPATIKGLLAENEGVRPAEEDVRTKADELVEEGRLERADGADGDRQYRPTDPGP